LFKFELNKYNSKGIADGVGGWRRHGIDPSQFAAHLMSNCAEIVHSGDFEHSRPDLIIESAYNKLEMLNNQKPIGLIKKFFN
jgi:protein phosphatase PTC7